MEEDFIDGERLGSDDEVIDDENHQKLLNAVSRSNRNDIRGVERSEASNVVSEFGLSRSKSDALDAGDLLNPLGKTIALAKVRKVVSKKKKKEKTLSVPLSKTAEELISRKAAYGKVCHEVGKWNTIARQNRNAEQLQFPLKQPPLYMDSMSEYVNRFEFKTPLELEMAAILDEKVQVNDSIPEEKTEAKEWTKVAMHDAIALRNDMRKLRARQTYQQAKDKKRNKIKSKKYHRILKRLRLKKETTELEELQKKNPQLLIEKLEEMEKNRASERMSLRHRNTGKWAKYNLLRKKMNLDSGRAIQEQIEMSRALTAKQRIESDSEDEETKPVNNEEKMELITTDTSNPWLSTSNGKTTNGQVVRTNETSHIAKKPTQGYLRYWENVNNENAKRKLEEKSEIVESSDDEQIVEDEPLIDEMLDRVTKLSDIQDVVINPTAKVAEPSKLISLDEKKVPDTSEEQVDPLKFITVEPKTLNFESKQMEMDDMALDDAGFTENTDQRTVVAEAFADDDLVQQFRDEKNASIEAEKPQDINLVLPGWGEWAGGGLKVPERKRKRFTLKAADAKVRKDQKLPHVIINEDGETPLQPHRLDKVPFPFRNKDEYERSVRDPIGKNWNPETAFTRFIAPKIITKVGTVIPPMDEDAVSKPKKKKKTKKDSERKKKTKKDRERKKKPVIKIQKSKLKLMS